MGSLRFRKYTNYIVRYIPEVSRTGTMCTLFMEERGETRSKRADSASGGEGGVGGKETETVIKRADHEARLVYRKIISPVNFRLFPPLHCCSRCV